MPSENLRGRKERGTARRRAQGEFGSRSEWQRMGEPEPGGAGWGRAGAGVCNPRGGGGPGARTASWGHVPMHACAGFPMQFVGHNGAAPHGSRKNTRWPSCLVP